MSKRNQRGASSEEDGKLTKEQEAIAKHIRFNCPTATTMFEGNEVHYFSGNKAVDTLWESKYANKAKKDPMFKTRDDCVHFITELHSKRLFFRAKKLVSKKKENKEKGNDSSADVTKSPKGAVEKRKEKKAKEEETATEAEGEGNENEDQKVEKKDEEKKKKKVKLLMHDIQSFVDDKDVYVWIFDPTPLMKKIIGVLMLVGTIVGCLFPLWPAWLRQGVYYVSITGIGCFAAIILTAILRTILFAIIYAVTFGKHKLWVLPNLTEDCGFFESFQPWYTYECVGDKKEESKKEKKEKKAKKEKNSDAEEEPVKEKKEKETVEEAEEEDDEDAEKYSQASTDENYEKIGDEDISVPPTPEEGAPRKRRPAKV